MFPFDDVIMQFYVPCEISVHFFSFVSPVGTFTFSYDTAPKCVLRDFPDDESTLVQLTAWWRKLTSQQDSDKSNIDQDIYRRMVSLCHNEVMLLYVSKRDFIQAL